jgi:hypothetical protein
MFNSILKYVCTIIEDVGIPKIQKFFSAPPLPPPNPGY